MRSRLTKRGSATTIAIVVALASYGSLVRFEAAQHSGALGAES